MSIAVSVIIVNWNTREIVLQCIRSVIASQDCGPIEIIVVDNGSSDGSVDAIRESFPQVNVLVNERNEGFSKANNRGIRASKGRSICLCNSDIQVMPDTIGLMTAHLERNPRIGLLGPAIRAPDGSFQASYRGEPTLSGCLSFALGLDKLFPASFLNPGRVYAGIQDTVSEVDVVVGAFWMMRRATIEKVGLLDEEFFFYAEDIDYCKRVRDAGSQIVFYPPARVTHRHAASSGKNPGRFHIEQRRADLLYWRKHHGAGAAAALCCILILHEAVRIGSTAALALVSSNRAHLFAKTSWHARCALWLIACLWALAVKKEIPQRRSV